MTRQLSNDQRNALKTAFKRVIADLGGATAAATVTRVGVSQLSEYGSVDSPKMVPADVIAELELIAGQPHITTALASLQGFDLMPRGREHVGNIFDCLARVSHDNGRLFADMLRMSGDSEPGEKERAIIARNLTDLIASARAALASL